MSRRLRCAIGTVLKASSEGDTRWAIQFTITVSYLSVELSAISYQLSVSYSFVLGENSYSLIYKHQIIDS
jgi:hypothetical protein